MCSSSGSSVLAHRKLPRFPRLWKMKEDRCCQRTRTTTTVASTCPMMEQNWGASGHTWNGSTWTNPTCAKAVCLGRCSSSWPWSFLLPRTSCSTVTTRATLIILDRTTCQSRSLYLCLQRFPSSPSLGGIADMGWGSSYSLIKWAMRASRFNEGMQNRCRFVFVFLFFFYYYYYYFMPFNFL